MIARATRTLIAAVAAATAATLGAPTLPATLRAQAPAPVGPAAEARAGETPAPEVPAQEASAREVPATEDSVTPTFLGEVEIFAYVENSGVLSPGDEGGEVNELRLYDFESDYSFNLAEVALKKPASELHPLGFGVVATAGRDAQKNHALGLFRDEDDVFPFEDTPEFDLQEVYASYRVPLGGGLTLKAGKFVTLLGYEVIESPLNPNASRSLLFTYAIPLTHAGALATYPLSGRLSVTAGPVLGWDVVDDNNDAVSWMGQIAAAPADGFAASLQGIVGPEQAGNTDAVRWVLDLVVNYTSVPGLLLGVNADVGREQDEASLVAADVPGDRDAGWWGAAAYAAYDWTDRFRTAVRLERFDDSDGVRTLAAGAGEPVAIWEATITLQANLWRGLSGRLEYRHDRADREVFDATGGGPGSKTQDTIGIAAYYVLP